MSEELEQELEAAGDGEADTSLTPKEEAFVEYFGNPESETFFDGTGSAARAGYASPRDSAWKLRRREGVRKALAQYHTKAAAALGQGMAVIEHVFRKAVEAKDWSTAARCGELIVKRAGGFLEYHIFDMANYEHHALFDQAKVDESRKLTRLLLTDDLSRQEQAQVASQQLKESIR